MVRKLLVFASGGMTDPASRIRGYCMAKYLSENNFDAKVCLYESIKGNVVRRSLHLIRDILVNVGVIIKSSKETLVYVQKGTCSLPQLSLIFSLLSKFILRKKVIYDIDDALFLKKRFVTTNIIRFSDLVIVGGHELLNYVKKYNKNAFIIPTSADLKRYSIYHTIHENSVRLGFVGSPSTTVYLNLLLKPLAKLAQNCDFELRIISARSYAEYRLFNSLFEKFEKKGVKVKLIPWSIEDEFHQLQNIDIGLAPLFNGEWEKYKCGFKVINYMATGIPPVASNVGENRYIIQDGVNGFLCKNNQDWTEKLRKFIDDEALRKNMGLNARRTVEERYSMEENAKILAKILAELR